MYDTITMVLIKNFYKKESLMAQMIQSAQALEEFEIYQSIPRIGAPTATLVIGELGDIRRFPTEN